MPAQEYNYTLEYKKSSYENHIVTNYNKVNISKIIIDNIIDINELKNHNVILYNSNIVMNRMSLCFIAKLNGYNVINNHTIINCDYQYLVPIFGSNWSLEIQGSNIGNISIIIEDLDEIVNNEITLIQQIESYYKNNKNKDYNLN